jgi:TRAP transporter TAXI family solute receptor
MFSKFYQSVLIFFCLALSSLPAAANTVALGTTKGGATAQISTALAKVISAAGDVQVRPQPMANTSQYIPMVNAGKIEFGIANNPQVWYAVDGSGMSSSASENLRAVATLFPFKAGIVVPSALGLKSFSDLAGKTVPRFKENSLGDFIIRAALNAGDLDYDDVKSFPVSNFPQMWDAMKQGQTVIAIAAVGSKPTYDLQAALNGITFLPFAASDGPKLAKLLPGAFVSDIAPNAELPGIKDGTRVFAYDYLLFAHKDVSDEIVTSVLEALFNGESDMKAAGPLFAEFSSASLGKPIDVEYHPAALAFFKSKGMN